MKVYKNVHVDSRVAIRSIEEPFIGKRRNIQMCLEDIETCLSRGASVIEILPDGSLQRLTAKNYTEDFCNNMKKSVEEKVIKETQTAEPIVITNEEVTQDDNTTEEPVEIKEEVIDIPEEDLTSDVVDEMDETIIEEDPTIDDAIEEEADVTEEETETTDEVVADENDTIEEDIVTLDNIGDFTKAELIKFANENGINVDGMNKTTIIATITEYLKK